MMRIYTAVSFKTPCSVVLYMVMNILEEYSESVFTGHQKMDSLCLIKCGPCSSVGIATGYRLDGPGSNPGGNDIFRPSRPALGSTQPPAKLVPGLPRGKVRPRRAADHSPPSSAAVMEE